MDLSRPIFRILHVYSAQRLSWNYYYATFQGQLANRSLVIGMGAGVGASKMPLDCILYFARSWIGGPILAPIWYKAWQKPQPQQWWPGLLWAHFIPHPAAQVRVRTCAGIFIPAPILLFTDCSLHILKALQKRNGLRFLSKTVQKQARCNIIVKHHREGEFAEQRNQLHSWFRGPQPQSVVKGFLIYPIFITLILQIISIKKPKTLQVQGSKGKDEN